MAQAKPSERVAILGKLLPLSRTANTYVSEYVDMEYFERGMAIVELGAISSSGTVNAKLRQATSSTGAGVKDISNKAITQLDSAGSDSSKQAIINFKAGDLDRANGFRYVALSLTTATAATVCSGLILGFDPKHGPANLHDVSSVDEIVG